MKICFVSDLHLFSQRSQAEQWMPLLHERIRESSLVVLGGDLFDFKWSTLGSAEATAQAATIWLKALMKAHPSRPFIMLLGNHDDHPLLRARLEDLAEEFTQLRVETYLFRVANTVFLHGDSANPGSTEARLMLMRGKTAHHRNRGRVMNLLYGGTIRLRLHRVGAGVIFPKRLVARRLLKYLREVGQGPESGTDTVYFGHTHLALRDYLYRGVSFHNCGAPMRGLRFQILLAETETPEG
ncbi:MAG: metallophosphoesterase [Verrucomicrobium sp.]|nr:metallophosphoesterase [Verrucomicrobium sp.]